MKWLRHLGAGTATVCCLVALSRPALAGDEPPGPWLRGASLGPPHTLELALGGAGVYVPAGVARSPAGLVEGRIDWSLALHERFGLVGQEAVGGMFWDNVTLLTLGTTLGARLVAGQSLTIEAFYLHHRVEQEWVEDDAGRVSSFALGGVRDHGGELGTWIPFSPVSRVRLDLHLLGRMFRVYENAQGVLGAGARLALRLVGDQFVIGELTLLRVARTQPRLGVEPVTYNLLSELSWRGRLDRLVGMAIGARASTSLLCGEVPMLELKRSMINEPMLFGFLAITFDVKGR